VVVLEVLKEVPQTVYVDKVVYVDKIVERPREVRVSLCVSVSVSVSGLLHGVRAHAARRRRTRAYMCTPYLLICVPFTSMCQ
jgi:hypothetical protein